MLQLSRSAGPTYLLRSAWVRVPSQLRGGLVASLLGGLRCPSRSCVPCSPAHLPVPLPALRFPDQCVDAVRGLSLIHI
eukprot:1773592-Alexandrium_andersonii.AAC.1